MAVSKYQLTSRSRTFHGIKVYQIKALMDIPRHNVKSGDKGGYITKYKLLSQKGDCWVEDNCVVIGDVKITGNALIGVHTVKKSENHSRVIGSNIEIGGNAILRGCSIFTPLEGAIRTKIESDVVLETCTVKEGALLTGNIYMVNSSVVIGYYRDGKYIGYNAHSIHLNALKCPSLNEVIHSPTE